MDYALPKNDQQDRIGNGLTGAILLHVVILGAIAAAAIWGNFHATPLGTNAMQAGAIQASMVAAIPLPQRVPPVEHQVLAPKEVSVAPTPPPKEATVAPPKPTDVLIKAKPPEKAKFAPIQHAAPPKQPQPVKQTPKATMGENATQLPEAITHVGTGQSALTVMNKTFGVRYAYYAEIVSRKVAENWYKTEADPRTSVGRSVVVTFDINESGQPENVRIVRPSGSPTLDMSATQALERIDTFGPLPGGMSSITVQDVFEYGNQ